MDTQQPEPIKEPTIPKTEPSVEASEETPESKLTEALKEYPFVTYVNGKFNVVHPELTNYLTPKLLKVGDIVKRGAILASLNGGASNVDSETLALNSFVATVQVGYSDLPSTFNLLNVEDTNLVTGLYVAIRSYNDFFRKTPLGIVI